VAVAENKAFPIPVHNVVSQDHKKLKKHTEEHTMGEVIALIRIMPAGVISDDELEAIQNSIQETVKQPIRLGRIEVKNVAFGLRGIDVTIAVPDSEGGLDPIVDELAKIENVESVEVVDVGRI